MKQPSTHEQPVPQHSEESVAKKKEAQAIKFLRENRNGMIAGAAVAFAIFLGFTYYMNQRENVQREATVKFFNAETVEDFQAIKTQYGNTAAGQYAPYMAGMTALEEGSNDLAIELLEGFIKENPKDEMVPAAQLAIAQALEDKGSTSEALERYKTIVNAFPQNFVTPEAQLGIARCYEISGDLEMARQTYNTIIADYGDKIWSQQADQRLQKIGIGTEKPGEEALESEEAATSGNESEAGEVEASEPEAESAEAVEQVNEPADEAAESLETGADEQIKPEAEAAVEGATDTDAPAEGIVEEAPTAEEGSIESSTPEDGQVDQETSDSDETPAEENSQP